MMLRFSSSSFTGIRRSEVAVGTERLLCMFSTIFSAGPRIGITSPSGCGFVSGAGAGAVAEAGTAGAFFVAAAVSPSVAVATTTVAPLLVSSSKYARHESSTSSGLLRNRSSKPWT